MRERRRRDNKRNMNRGLVDMDNMGIHCGSGEEGGDGDGENNGENGGATVNEQ